MTVWKPLLLLLLVSHWGCGGALVPEQTPRATTSATPSPPTISVGLKRSTGGFGAGPAYSLTVRGDGEVIFEGAKNTRVIGVAKAGVSSAEVQRVLAEFQKLDYFSLADRYDYKEDCPEYVTDMPVVTTSLTLNGRSKSVIHNTGCTGTPTLEKLTALEKMIDDVADAMRWVE